MIDIETVEFKFSPRGLGSNWLPCFLCGHEPRHKCQADMASFIDSTLAVVSSVIKDDDGKPYVNHPILTFLHELDVLVGKLDYRDWEPNHLQLKLGACGEHAPNLHLLCELTRHDDKLTKRRLEMVIPGRKVP